MHQIQVAKGSQCYTLFSVCVVLLVFLQILQKAFELSFVHTSLAAKLYAGGGDCIAM